MQFSTSVSASPDMIEWAKQYYGSEQHQDDLTERGIDADFDDGGCSGFSVEYYPDDPEGQIVVFAEEYGDPTAAAHFLHKLLQHSNSDEIVLLGWAETCSALRPDEFGGGYVASSREGYTFAPSPYLWFEKHKAELLKCRAES